MPKYGVIASGIFMANQLQACLALFCCLVHSSLLKGYCYQRQGGCQRPRSKVAQACLRIVLGGRAARRIGDK